MYSLIFNPVAGRGRAQAKLGEVRDFFAGRKLPLRVYLTHHRGHATEIVSGLPEDATVLSLGGDGTLHEVAAACIYTKRTVGIVPAGSGDDFAHALGIRGANALETVHQGKVRSVDTGLVNTHAFVNAFGVGFDADVAYGLPKAPGYLKGKAAYAYTVLKTLHRLECLPVHIDVDESRVFEGRALLVSAQNGPRTGGSFLFAPHASPADGLLDVVVAEDLSRLETVKVLPSVISGKHLGHPKVHLFRGKQLRIAWHRPRPAHLDGELLAPTATFEATLQPQSLRVFVP